MKLLALFLTYVAKILEKHTQVAMKVVHLTIIVIFFIAKKIMNHINKCIPSSWLNSGHFSHNVVIIEQKSGPKKNFFGNQKC